MSYSTALYAVDLDRLRAAIGSRDEGIVDLIKRKHLNRNVPSRCRVLRVEVADDEAIRLDGKPASIDAFVAEMQELTQPGDNVRFHPSQSETGKRLGQAMIHTWQAMYASSGFGPMLYSCAKEQVWDEDDDFSPADTSDQEDAIRKLVFGDLDVHVGSDYAYALEYLCKLYGRRLNDDDALGDLEPLGLNSALCNWRMPVAIPKPDNFPYVSYLTAEEVTAEASRLEKVDLSFPEDEDNQHARRILLRCLKQARKNKAAIVAFYY